ncbi:hypothetical protein C8R41DRAFT_921954 [Lentinula lateritia]|uniref:Uncharacterized protein n=1 Tax=Lentinula lateritia TaxID=40482 RepID=A0ABQ8V9X8_9AGAR|nr:hypothetical protein C8R41DRAFT_921954 [Lentinula lateritia]
MTISESSPREPTTPGVYILRSSYALYLFTLRPIQSYVDGPPWTLQEPLQGSHLLALATTRSFPSSVAVSVAPFELRPAPSTLPHKLIIPKTYPKTYSDPGLTAGDHDDQDPPVDPDDPL